MRGAGASFAVVTAGRLHVIEVGMTGVPRAAVHTPQVGRSRPLLDQDILLRVHEQDVVKRLVAQEHITAQLGEPCAGEAK